MTTYSRNCPGCGKELTYKTKQDYMYSIHGRDDFKPSGLCISCAKTGTMGGEKNPMYGRHHSEETKLKIKEARKYQITTDETRRKISEGNLGKDVSEETKKRMSSAFTGRKYSEETRKRMSEARKQYFKNMTDEERAEYSRKIRLGKVKERAKKGYHFPNYNKASISLIESYGKSNGYNFQHAENGGEFFIAELGYWVDAYDKEKNVVLEVDERHHYNIDGSLREKDVIRQKEIEEFLSCKFIRIRI